MSDELRGAARYLMAKDIAAELSVSLTTAYEIVRQ